MEQEWKRKLQPKKQKGRENLVEQVEDEMLISELILRQKIWEIRDWVYLIQQGDQFKFALKNAVILWVSQRAGNFLSKWGKLSFWTVSLLPAAGWLVILLSNQRQCRPML